MLTTVKTSKKLEIDIVLDFISGLVSFNIALTLIPLSNDTSFFINILFKLIFSFSNFSDAINFLDFFFSTEK